ncbi:hypothetical protein N431DRAFT_478013 [Stipitochalara longipes BDJ]|nr:hypothetical protein N431DRAFT_478013 [Stipitochalara longipes BDJ]
MSGFEVVGLLLGLYPLVVDAVNVYKATKTGRAATSLIRKLRVEEVVYHQFVYKLLAPNVPGTDIYRLYLNQELPDVGLWQEVALNQKLRIRLGAEKADIILDILREIESLLRDLNTYLSSISRGMEVLDKFRSSLRVAMYNKPQSSFQQRLARLNQCNKDLNRLLDGDDLHLSPSASSQSPRVEATSPQFLVRDCQEVIQLYQFILREGYDCDCNDPHETNFGLNCPAHSALVALPDFKGHKWDFELVLPPSDRRESGVSELSVLDEAGVTSNDDSANDRVSRPTRSEIGPNDENLEPPHTRQRRRSISITEVKNRPPSEINNNSWFRDICSFVQNVNTHDPTSEDHRGIIGKKTKRYKLSIKPDQGHVLEDITTLEDLLKPSSKFLRKDRMQLALWLSCSILQFYHTGWIDNAWTSKDVGILSAKEEQQDENSQLIQLFVTRRFYSARISTSEPTRQTLDNLESWYDEPILTKLGFALIELAFCRQLSEIRNDTLHKDVKDDSSDFTKMQTAIAVLDSGLLAREESPVYEAVVRACIKHQYPGDSSSGPKGLDSKDASFFDRAEESIIGPLSVEFAKTWGPK